MTRFLKLFLAFAAACFAAAIFSSVFSTQFVISALQDIGVDIPFSTRLAMTWSDLAILQTLLLVIAACFLVGFLVAALASSKLGGNRQYWYITAGACALLTVLLLMDYVLQLMPIAGARTNFGLLTQAVAGAIGGFVFSLGSNASQTINHSSAE